MAFVFAPDFASPARRQVWLMAFEQAFFSLGVGGGTLAPAVCAAAWRTMLRWVVPAVLAAVFVGSARVG